LLLVQAESLGHRDQSFRSESALRVDIHCHAFTTSLSDWQLAGNAQGVADLGLTCSELSEDFSD
jgi:hypothetical protein